MYQLEMVDQTPNFPDPKSSEILRSNSCDLARPVAICSRALHRGWGPLAYVAGEGHLEVVQALLAAGASVEAKDNKGPGPQRQDRCHRTDVVGKAVQEVKRGRDMT